jgi:hypothetical protein
MMNQDVVGGGQVQKSSGQVFGRDPWSDEVWTGIRHAQYPLDAQHFVTDGVAVAKGCEYLMDGGSHR